MTSKENEAKQVQVALNLAIDAIVALPPEVSMDIFASMGLDYIRTAGSDGMFKEFTKNGSFDIYIDNMIKYIEQLTRLVKASEQSRNDRIAFTEKVHRHMVN